MTQQQTLLEARETKSPQLRSSQPRALPRGHILTQDGPASDPGSLGCGTGDSLPLPRYEGRSKSSATCASIAVRHPGERKTLLWNSIHAICLLSPTWTAEGLRIKPPAHATIALAQNLALFTSAQTSGINDLHCERIRRAQHVESFFSELQLSALHKSSSPSRAVRPAAPGHG